MEFESSEPTAASQHLTMRISGDLLRRIGRAAAADRRSVSSWARLVLERAVEADERATPVRP